MKFPKDDLQIGKAGEYLVCADLILAGYKAFLGDQGSHYDIILGIKDRLLRVQVKTTREPLLLPGRKILGYRFYPSRNGKGGKKVYKKGAIDLIALVTLDTREIGYLTCDDIKSSAMTFRSPNHVYQQAAFWKRTEQIKQLQDEGLRPHEIARKLNIPYNAARNVFNSTRGIKYIRGMYLKEFPLKRALQKLGIKK